MTTRYASPLRYPGGKARMTSWLAERMLSSPSMLDIEVWIEPFGGGLGAALTALLDHGIPEVWACELNPTLHAFWTCALESEDLADRVEQTTATIDLFWKSRDLVAASLAGEAVPVDELGYAAFVLNRCSRSGMVLGNVGPMGGKAQTGKWLVDARFARPDRLADRLRVIAGLGRTRRLILQGHDGISRIEELPGSGVEHEVFVFADPPYVGVGNRLYAEGMDAGLHRRLATALDRCPAPWALTYDEHPDVAELYRDHRIDRFEIPHSAHRGKIGAEYLITPYWSAPVLENPLGRGGLQRVAEAARIAVPA